MPSKPHYPSVLYIGPLPPPTGGVALALEALTKCSVLEPFPRYVFNTSHGRPTEVVGTKTVTPERLIRRVKLAGDIARYVHTVRPDVIHFQYSGQSLATALGDFIMFWASGINLNKQILHMHIDPRAAGIPGAGDWSQRLFRIFSRRASVVFTLLEDYRKYLEQIGMRQTIRVVPNLCDDSIAELALNRHGRSGVVRVAFIGRLSQAKGFFDLLQLAAALKVTHPQIHFEIAGLPSTTQDAERIREIYQQDHLQENVSLLGLVRGKEKLALLERSDIIILPSYGESSSIVAVETMAAGLPLLGTKVAGLRGNTVDGETAFLVTPGDIQEMKDRLVQLVEDADLRQRMGCAGRDLYRERFSSAKIGQVVFDTYMALAEDAVKVRQRA